MVLRRLALLSALLPACVAAHGSTLHLQIIGSDGAALEHAVAYFDVESGTATAGTHAEMDHRDMQYQPHVLPVQRGTLVDFPNRDQVRHHVYSFSPAKRFELPLYSGRPAEPVLFDVAGSVVLGCNIHDHMVGYILVLDSAHFAAAGDDGGYRLTRPSDADDAELVIWHPVLERQGAVHRQVVAADVGDLVVELDVLDEPPAGPEGLQHQRRRGLEERFQRHRGHD
ncbi:plastocyanin [Natronocella acetinitrilica]|uniref:Plastocyanin n=1 Tax=Natronocella acetinitrilica TaxID=414046 RepID=A0AAE3G162_9GAMM|nr:methylamine utilization protein [Natronocella acetinitrilica]MCP1673665.1 plastocyanin [Natronocella acetinitrilica]